MSTLYEKMATKEELDEAIKRGASKGISIVANALFESAKSGDKTAQIFYLKCRAGWREPAAENNEASSLMQKLIDKL